MKKLFSYDKFPQGKSPKIQNVEIRCVNCATTQFEYQKIGSGVIEKIILSSIIGNNSITTQKELICPKCDKLLGKKIDKYFRLYPGSIYYKVIKPKNSIIPRI